MDRGAQNNMDNQDTKKTKRLARGAIRRMILLAVVLILGIGTAVVSIFWEQDLQMYSDFAYSYTRMAAETIDGDRVREYIETGETDEYYEKIRQLLNVIAENADLRYMYVVIPQENGLLYVWDAQPEHDARPLLDLWEYSSDYPRYAAEAAYNEGTEQFEAYRYKDMDLATAISPLKDSEGNTVAIVAADLLITRIREGIIKILVNLVASVGVIMIMAMAIYYFTVRRQILTPLETLKEAVSGIVDNLDRKESVKIDVHTGDEIETVARSIEEMDGKLRSYIDENSRITAEKERVNTELALATRIQADMLPNIFPAFPDRTEFNIHAFMTPAKEVGGDFYDFFFVDHDHMALVIADVSGKGVPAAMFMMMVKSMIQTQVMSGHSPKDALETVNQLICDNNKEGMFISVWLGIVDVKSGVLIAANAGHEYPIIKKPGGNFEILKDKHGFVIGGMEGMKYTEYELLMEPGAKLFVYTDGVPEATDCHFDLFGMDRTLEALNSAADADPEGILKAVEDAVAEFVGRAEQFDDLTMLCFEYKGE